MSRPMKRMLLSVGIVFGLLILIYVGKQIIFKIGFSLYVPPPVTISAAVATTKDWQSFISSAGTITAVNGVDVSAEVGGIVKEIRFDSGQTVKKGDILVTLDTSIEQAQLRDNEAQTKLAQLNYDRNKPLLAKHAVSQSQLDTLAAQLDEAIAGVEQIQAKIRQKTIIAPFDGQIGIKLINIGQYLSAGTTMVTLQSMDPLYVQFNIPEQYLSELYLQQPVKISVNLAGGRSIMGVINAINSKVEQTTRNVLIQATIPNTNKQIYPGMFALVEVQLRKHKDTVTLPQTAIAYSLHGDSIFVIRQDGKDKDDKPILKAYRQYVTVGERRGSEVAILKGLKAGDQVVTSGQLKLQNATHVVIDNSVEL